jgi:hypothetical protein
MINKRITKAEMINLIFVVSLPQSLKELSVPSLLMPFRGSAPSPVFLQSLVNIEYATGGENKKPPFLSLREIEA